MVQLTGEQKYYLAKGGSNKGQAWTDDQLNQYNSDLSATNPEKEKYIAGAAGTSPYAYGREPNDPLNQYNTQTGMINDNYGGGGTNTSTATTGPTTPTAPEASAGPSPAELAMEKYYQSLMPNSDQVNATNYYNDLYTKSQLANEKALNSGDTLGFAAGEAQRVGRNFDIKLGGAARNVEAQAALASNRSAAEKARMEYEQNKMKTATEQQRYDTEQAQYKAEQEAASRPGDIKLSEGQSNWSYDPETGRYVQTAAVPKYINPLDNEYTRAQINAANALAEQRRNNKEDEDQYVINSTSRNELLGLGMQPSQVDQLQSDIRKYGKKAVIDKQGDNGTILQQILDKQGYTYYQN